MDLLAGHIAATATSTSSSIAYVRSGKLRALGVTSLSRVAVAPDIPTIAESGLPGYEAVQWSGLLAPARTPREIIARLHKEAVAVLRMPDTRERLAGDGSEVVASSPEEFGKFLKAELVKWEEVVKLQEFNPNKVFLAPRVGNVSTRLSALKLRSAART